MRKDDCYEEEEHLTRYLHNMEIENLKELHEIDIQIKMSNYRFWNSN